MYEKENGLPEIARQTGPVTGQDEVYIEDYAYGYLRKLKNLSGERYMQAAMYGKMFLKEGGHVYLIYGIALVEDDAQSFFEEYELLGYVNLHSFENKGDTQSGCFIFYEANDAMQEYLLSKEKQRMVLQEQVLCNQKLQKDKGQHRLFAMGKLIQKLLLLGMLLLVVAAVTGINHYEGMCEFAVMAEKATQQIR